LLRLQGLGLGETPLIKLYMAVSGDGFIATPDGGIDWLDPFDTSELDYSGFLDGISTVVMGRVTYEQLLSYGPWPYEGKRGIILSSREFSTASNEIEIRNGEIAPLVKEWKDARSGDVWILGGARTLRPFLNGRHVDRIELFVFPVLLGDGIPLFERSQVQQDLKLVQSKPFSNGVVRLIYDRAEAA
jgi:dihydrofolate reductase